MTRPRVLAVGHQPVSGTVGESHGIAFVHTPSGRRLAHYAGLPHDEALMDHLTLVNVYRDPWAKHAYAEGRRRGRAIELEFVRGRVERVLLFGGVAADAFGTPYHPLLEWRDRSVRGWPYRLATVPHPSGLTRWWNDQENVARARAFLRDALELPSRL